MSQQLILFPHQLFSKQALMKHSQLTEIFLIEDPLFFGTDPYYPLNFHPQKLILLRTAMKRYADEVLSTMKTTWHYVEFKQIKYTDLVFEIIKKWLSPLKLNEVLA